MKISEIINEQVQIEFKLMNPNSIFNQFIPHRYQMIYVAISGLTHKFGYIWENIVSAFTSFQKLPKGIDFVDHNRKIFMELKNNFNTPNHDSKQNIIKKMRYALNKNPGYICIFGAVNDTCDRSDIDENGIVYLTRGKLLKFLFGKNAQLIYNITMQEMQLKINELQTQILACENQIITNMFNQNVI